MCWKFEGIFGFLPKLSKNESGYIFIARPRAAQSCDSSGKLLSAIFIINLPDKMSIKFQSKSEIFILINECGVTIILTASGNVDIKFLNN